MSDIEATLATQAVALNSIFNELARRAALNMSEHLNATEIYLRLGLKAQAQCRATLETLAEMKNPRPVAFVRQANIANGPQQVNNGKHAGADLPTRAHAGNPANRANELLVAENGERLDSKAAGIPSGSDQQLEAVVRVHRPKTEQGKTISAMNARKHGLRSRKARKEAQLLRDLIRFCGETAREL